MALNTALSDYGQQVVDERYRLLSQLVQRLTGVQVRRRPLPPPALGCLDCFVLAALYGSLKRHCVTCSQTMGSTMCCSGPAWRQCSTTSLRMQTRARWQSSWTGLATNALRPVAPLPAIVPTTAVITLSRWSRQQQPWLERAVAAVLQVLACTCRCRLGERFGENAQFDRQRALQLLRERLLSLELPSTQATLTLAASLLLHQKHSSMSLVLTLPGCVHINLATWHRPSA
jgi:hypothetical protein